MKLSEPADTRGMNKTSKTELQIRDAAEVAVRPADHGLLLHSSAGDSGLALLPKAVRPWAAVWMTVPPAIISGLALLLGNGTPEGILGAVGLGGAAWFGASRLIPHQLRVLARLRSRKHLRDGMTMRSPGTAFRLRGRVRARDTFLSSVNGHICVFAKYEIRGERARPQRRVRGVDFEVEAENGVVVAVPAAEVFLDAPFGEGSLTPRDLAVLGRPSVEPGRRHPFFEFRTAGPGKPIATHLVTYKESLLCPGDLVEISGIVAREVDPAGSGDASSRTPPMRFALRASHALPIFVRKL